MTTLPQPAGTGPIGLSVRLSGVVHLYPSPEGDVVALRGVDLEIPAGGSVALLGPSGAGKSTVLSLIAGEFAPSAGSVRVGESDVGRLGPDELTRLRAREISLVVQGSDHNLLSYATVFENVWFAQHGARRRRYALAHTPDELLSLFDLTGLSDSPVERLSSGQRQRVALVAGVAVLPSVLLVDEPTSQLSAGEADSVIETIVTIHRLFGVTVIVVTHDPEVARHLERTVTIRDGRVGAEGRDGTDYAIVGRDGSIRLPDEVLDVLPHGCLVQVLRQPGVVTLRPVGDEEPDR